MPVLNGLTFTLADGVWETTQTTGTGPYTLEGAKVDLGRTYRSFLSGLGNGVRTGYAVRLGAGLEVGLGTVSSPSNLSRDSILFSTNGNNAVNWGSGAKDVHCDISAALSNQIWAKPGGSLPFGAVETRGPFAFSGTQSQMEFLAIANTARVIHVGFSNITRGDGSQLLIQLGDAGGYESTGYVTQTHWATASGSGIQTASTAWVIAAIGTSGNIHFGSVTMINLETSPGFWTYAGSCFTGGTQAYTDHSAGAKAVSATFDRFRLTNGAAANFGAGGTVSAQIIHGVT